MLEAIYQRFGIAPALPAEIALLIKQADQIAAFLEATQLAGFSKGEALEYFTVPKEGEYIIENFPKPIIAQPVHRAEQQFLHQFHMIEREC